MKKNIKRFGAILLVFALIVGIAPLWEGGEASAHQYFYFSTPANSKTYKAGAKVPVKFWAGIVKTETKCDAWGNPTTTTYNEMPAQLKVYKGSTEIYSEDFKYTKGQWIKTTYVPNVTGTLTLKIYGQQEGLNQYGMVQYDSRTIKVTKPKASAVKKIKPAITVERTAKKKATITCTNNAGFGMKIYRATSKSGKYKLIKTTKKMTYTDTKLSASKVYYYKVRLYAKSGKKTLLSKWSAKTKAPKYTGGLQLSYTSSKGVKIKWNKVSGAGYYLVGRNTSGTGAEYEVISCEGAETTTYYDKDVKKGKTYYYNVVAYDGSDKVLKKYMNNSFKIKIN